MRNTAGRRDHVPLAVWVHSDLPLTTIRVLLEEGGEMTPFETQIGGERYVPEIDAAFIEE